MRDPERSRFFHKLLAYPRDPAHGCFSRITFERSDSGRFRTRYEAASREALDAYFRDHAERLRQDFRRRFPQGVVPSREVWTEVERWGGDPENVR